MKKTLAILFSMLFALTLVSCAAQKKAEFKKKASVKVTALQVKIKAIEEKAAKAVKNKKADLQKAASGAKARLADIQDKLDNMEKVAEKDLDDFLAGLDAGMNNLSDNLEQFISSQEEKASESQQQ